MPTRFLSDAELAQLSAFQAEVGAENLVTYFILTEVDRRWLVDEHRGAANQLGAGLQYCTLSWLGFVPDDLNTAPPAVIGRLADQLAVDAGGTSFSLQGIERSDVRSRRYVASHGNDSSP